MNSGESNDLDDSLADAARRYQEICLKICNKEYSNGATKKSLFPKKSTKPPLRKSLVRRAFLKKNLPTSTPMTCTKKKQFSSDSLSSMSPIPASSEKKLTSSQKQTNKDSFICISSDNTQTHLEKKNDNQPGCSYHSATNNHLSPDLLEKKENLNNVIAKLAAKSCRGAEQSQVVVANSERKQEHYSRRHIKSLARNLFNNSVVDCEIQTGSSLMRNDAEDNSLEEILAECEKDKKFDSAIPWRAPSGLQPYQNCDKNSFVVFNSSADEDTLNDTFVPKLAPQRKTFANKKKRGRPRKDKSDKRKSDSVCSSVRKSSTITKLQNQSHNNDLTDSNRIRQNKNRATSSKMVQTECQIEDVLTTVTNENFHLNESVQSFKGKKATYLASGTKITVKKKNEFDQHNEHQPINKMKKKSTLKIIETRNNKSPNNSTSNTSSGNLNASQKDLRAPLPPTKLSKDGNTNEKTRQQKNKNTANNDNIPSKPKRGRPKKSVLSRENFSNTQPSTSKAVHDDSLPEQEKQNPLRRSTRQRRPILKRTLHTLWCSTVRTLNQVQEKTPKQSFADLSNKTLLINTLLYNTKPLTPVEEIENENSKSEETQNHKSVTRKETKKTQSTSGKVRKKRNVKEKQEKVVKALSKTLDQQTTLENILNFDENISSQINRKKWYFQSPSFREVDMPGVSVATVEGVGTGLLQIKPKKKKIKQSAAFHDLTFTVVQGRAYVEVENQHCVFKKYDIFKIGKGTEYCIENMNKVQNLVLVYSKFKS